MKVNAIRCPKCGDIIYSRARHDFHTCSCGEVYIDGGFDYTRIGFTKKTPQTLTLNVKATKRELYADWNNQTDKFGLIKGNKK